MPDLYNEQEREIKVVTKLIDLIDKAKSCLELSYSPYSKFKVSAAVRGGSGKIYSGVNIENISYGLTMCAERVAIFNAISSGEEKISEVAIVCEATSKDFTTNSMPCGACLQVMQEFSNGNLKVIIDGEGTFDIGELLTRPFKAEVSSSS